MVQLLSIIFFLGFLQFLLGFSKVPVFLCHSVHPQRVVEILFVNQKLQNISLSWRNVYIKKKISDSYNGEVNIGIAGVNQIISGLAYIKVCVQWMSR